MAIYTFTINNITVTVNLPIFEETILADQVLSPSDWIEGFAKMVSGKVANVKSRIADEEVRQALKKGRINRLPATEDAIVKAVFARSNYKNRADREKGN